MLGLTFDKVLILAVIAVVVLGPERLPQHARQLAGLIRQVRMLLGAAQARARDELGPEFDAIDWKRLDPRQYDPRRIIRQALLDEPSRPASRDRPAPAPSSGSAMAPATPARTRHLPLSG